MTDVMSGAGPEAGMRHTWDWTPEEHRRMSRSLFRHMALRFWMYGLIGVGIVGLAASLWSAARSGVADWMLISLLLICVASFTYSIVWEMPRKSARLQVKFHSGLRWLVIDEEGLQGGCEMCSMRIGWSKVRKAVETRDFIFVFISANLAFWLPKRAASDSGELERARRAIREKLGPRAKLHAA